MFRTVPLLATLVCLAMSPGAFAQGIIWSLPEDGSLVHYEGTYRQVEAQPGSSEGNLEMEWIRHLTIKSVGKEDAEFKGKVEPCRWIEIKVQTGRVKDGLIATGTVGERIYKVLVPESAVIGQTRNSEGLPVTFLPIVRGFRKTNDKDPTPKEITSKVLQVYPMISLVRHYKDMTRGSVPEVVQVGQEDVQCTKLTGSFEQESQNDRVLHETTLYLSDAVPFGLAKWTVKISQEAKGEVEPRSEFQFVSEITVDMTARRIESNARSELVVQ
ncbi:MAG: hypothetical protein O2983_11765 [Planctomycetota bacterium]|jgi:hypothetical protein|nr:hypothetical protein [Planctomycetota bacterium]MDA0920584.1 hypothetical protein [Planctomycetota bacterium]MDA1160277.1 hypothetical protein [Planctomycetota bacterium]